MEIWNRQCIFRIAIKCNSCGKCYNRCVYSVSGLSRLQTPQLHLSGDMCSSRNHDDIIKWKHFPCNWPFEWEFTGPRWIPAQRPVTRSFDVFFDLHRNKWQSKQWWGWWFETSSSSLWRHCNVILNLVVNDTVKCCYDVVQYHKILHK